MIFVDASVPRSVAAEIKKARSKTVWIGDVFPLDTKDTVWLAEAGRQGWLVITRDKKIRKRPGERRVITESGAGCFVLVYREDLKKSEIAEMILSFLEEMESLFERTPRPFIYTVTKNGDFKQYRL
ncbi:Hypothetical Protein RradSPS_0335 [Rubrobacter radiotolerans]|uniref:VapC45 PIN like domain-containing protein n=1 Tax=Rubrobacter radiotolerans TaxID=42256 RepID=A0A023WZY3_RUBRA|nr:DUF5615 family PIN-like protein [Rubrobacter radiotolerans]AHY45618.1 Hypothetical Protein RradSPS_0335 [Rubrobacter radiotolerans]MDX5893031.1 hypothetical protein [Rubrobacter radiotolerans]SMC02932.1 conserved hypothetical protein [Rubrobacter radiotolerans DSM 5868]